MNNKATFDLNIRNPDEFYEKLLSLHHDLSFEDSVKLNAKLVLLLCNHIGDWQILNEIFSMSKNELSK